MKQHNIKLGGLDISFPYVPYGIQKAMLAKIAVALTNKEHALIESPTGTGKSLSLLCSTLAWRQQSKEGKTPVISSRLKSRLHEERRKKLESRPCSCGRRPDCLTELDELKEAKGKKDQSKGQYNYADDLEESALKKVKKSDSDDIADVSPYFNNKKADQKKKKSEPEYIVIDSDDDNDVEIMKKQAVDNDKDKEMPDEKIPVKNGDTVKVNELPCRNCEALVAEDVFIDETGLSNIRINVTRIPKIYYGTRTHKQISQVVRELNKTTYTKDLRMNILSSRDRTCINDEVKDQADRNDKCQELIKGHSKSSSMSKSKSNDSSTCPFYKDSNQMAADFEAVYQEYENDAWDIEDAVKFGTKFGLCPYYGLRALQDDADITFCPYNYLLDTNIRTALNINLKNAVIILDEAHNIEDICRDSASYILTTTQIDELLNNINRASQNYLQGSKVHDAYMFFKNLFTDIKAFLLRFNFEFENQQRDGDCLARRVMSHDEMMNGLQMMDLGPSKLAIISENLKTLRGDDEENSDKARKEDTQDAALNANELQLIIQLKNTLDFIYADNSKYSTDYRCIVAKLLERIKPGFKNANRISNGDVHVFQFSLICMNSSIAFQKIHEHCWSVIVASGTLSPIESLKTELGCQFSQVFEGSHVIDDDRIFATILSYGPNRVDLNCSYANSLRLDFQDEIGLIVRDVCRTIPNGVLVFFPSYDRMENLYQRWFSKGYIKDIQSIGKKIFREQRSYTASKFEEELKKYYKSATGKNGAMMMAVYRGKISEGIDFSDSAARAVLSIGIPYPNVKEITIGLKKEYNDLARRQRPELMNGRDWYQAQAFRALNQALGRVIRHKDDWGSIIMIDSRLNSSQSVNNISKWIRRCVSTPNDYEFFRLGLRDFVQKREEVDEGVIEIAG